MQSEALGTVADVSGELQVGDNNITLLSSSVAMSQGRVAVQPGNSFHHRGRKQDAGRCVFAAQAAAAGP